MSRVYTVYLHEVDLFKVNVGKTYHTFILWIFMIENLVEKFAVYPDSIRYSV